MKVIGNHVIVKQLSFVPPYSCLLKKEAIRSVHWVNICRCKLSQLAKHEPLQTVAKLAWGGKLSQLGAENRMSWLIMVIVWLKRWEISCLLELGVFFFYYFSKRIARVQMWMFKNTIPALAVTWKKDFSHKNAALPVISPYTSHPNWTCRIPNDFVQIHSLPVPAASFSISNLPGLVDHPAAAPLCRSWQFSTAQVAVGISGPANRRKGPGAAPLVRPSNLKLNRKLMRNMLPKESWSYRSSMILVTLPEG